MVAQATVVRVESQAQSRVIKVSEGIVGPRVKEPLSLGHAGDVAVPAEVALVVTVEEPASQGVVARVPGRRGVVVHTHT